MRNGRPSGGFMLHPKGIWACEPLEWHPFGTCRMSCSTMLESTHCHHRIGLEIAAKALMLLSQIPPEWACSGCTPFNTSRTLLYHYNDVIMGVMASPITSLLIVYSTIYSGADQRKYQSSVSLAFVGVIHQCPVNSPHKWQVTRKMFQFDDKSNHDT